MRRLSVFLGAVAVATFAVACAQSDADITATVKSKISTDRSITAASQINVSTNKKIVTLSGTAENPIAKERAVTLARSTEEVKSVVDNLTVQEAQAEVPPNTSASAGPPGAAVDDAQITSMIQSKLQQDRRVAGSKIDVETRLGIVTLQGTVKSEQVKQDAMQIAQDTAGVQRVENRLTVTSS